MNRNNIFIILLLQATYTVQEKEFIFPSEIKALIDSCVEIPCTVRTSATEPKNNKVVWHIVKLFPGSRIIYSSDPSEISTEYKNRAALIGSPEDSCSLRIHKVTKKDEKEYYPGDRKLPYRRKVPEYVNLWVTDVPPQPVLSVPEDIVHGTPTLVTCSVEHTCATSPPFLTWNISGLPLTEYNKDLGNGKYLKTSELTYLPTSRDYKDSSILCMATFPNGQTSRTAAKLNIIEVEKNVNRDFRMGIIVACLISLLLVAFFIWRFLLGNKASTSKTPNLIRIKNDSFGTKGTKETRYTDLMKRDNSVYCVIEPATQKMIQGKTHLPEYANIYEDMRPPYTGISK